MVYPHQSHRWVCRQCAWKSKVQRGDVLIPIKTCPRCKGQDFELKTVSTWLDTLFPFR